MKPLFRDALKGLYRPMLLVAIGLHVLLLLLPLPEEPKPNPQPVKTIKLTDLLIPMQRVPRQSETSPLKPIPKPTVQKPTPKVISSPQHGLPKPAAIARSMPTPTATATPTPTSGSVSAFLEQLASGNDNAASDDKSPSPDRFTDPSLFFDRELPLDPAKLKPDILRATWIADKTPIQVYVEILVVQGRKSNFQVFERGIYGQGTVYEVKQEDQTWYFNLVPSKNADGTAIVVWRSDPSAPLKPQ